MTEKNTRRRNAVIAAAAGAALLIGGSTYALWSATDNITGGTITAGQLGLIAGTTIEYDVSADRTDSSVAVIKNAASAQLAFAADEAAKVLNVNANADTGVLSGHEIDIASWTIVPGDTVAVTIPLTVTLEGDNLVAALTIDTTDLVGTGITNTKMTYSYAIFGENGAQIGSVENLQIADAALPVALFQADSVGQDYGVDDTTTINDVATTVPKVQTDHTARVTLVIFGNFNVTAGDDNNENEDANMRAADVLGTIEATLTQIRCTTDQFGATACS